MASAAIASRSLSARNLRSPSAQDSRSPSAQDRHAFQSKRKNWCSTNDPSRVKGVGEKSLKAHSLKLKSGLQPHSHPSKVKLQTCAFIFSASIEPREYPSFSFGLYTGYAHE